MFLEGTVSRDGFGVSFRSQQRTGPFLKFFWCFSDFITQCCNYFSAMLLVLHLEQLALYQSFSSGVAGKYNHLASGKQGPIPEEMSQTLLTNKKQGNLDKVHASNIINPRPLFMPRTDHACHQKPNPSRERVPLKLQTGVRNILVSMRYFSGPLLTVALSSHIHYTGTTFYSVTNNLL